MKSLDKYFPCVSNNETYGSIELSIWKKYEFQLKPFIVGEQLLQDLTV